MRARADSSALEPFTEGEAPSRVIAARRGDRIQPPGADDAAIIALVDALAELTADLWFRGKLDALPVAEEHDDASE